ncbi:RNA-directed DNA polymerase from mobile element jockey [Plakobranchus ocellatus]|uniref:RNA-directed DNA polymerase from mobile element jockey n=1 Tax=Plakobranchus ocellatus TaxID=259542 RepID=A0AAV4BA43_9GAST|nr:RNA-directed DNA polymerase from mobile element jockey [Plakobranchus ocellatus]
MSLQHVLMVCTTLYQFLRHLPESCLHILLKIFNYIWTTGDISPSLREASVVPILKPGTNPSDPSNYRPIALTSCLCKTLELMVNDRLVHVLESRNLLPKVSDFRFRRPPVSISLNKEFTLSPSGRPANPSDGSKLDETVAAAAYFLERPDCLKATRLRDGSSVFSAELD